MVLPGVAQMSLSKEEKEDMIKRLACSHADKKIRKEHGALWGGYQEKAYKLIKDIVNCVEPK